MRPHRPSSILPILLGSAAAALVLSPAPPAQARTRAAWPAPPAQTRTRAAWPAPEARGLIEVTGNLHIHSPYSHDACDGQGLDEYGNINVQCLEDLREGVCNVPRRFYFWTDHPSHMSDQVFEDLFLFDADRGDRLVYDTDGRIIANELTCSRDGQSWKTWFMVGLEGSHNMPVGLEDHLYDHSLYGVGFGTGEDINAQWEEIDAIHDVDGLALLAHAEEDDVTADRVIGEAIDGLELYNAHSNINNVLQKHIFQMLELDNWIEGATNAPESDYVALLMFPYKAREPVQKWDQVTPVMPMPGVIGTDVHEDVILDPYCTMPPIDRLCNLLRPFYPNLVNYLEVGGPIPMADGTRLDSYTRMLRWFSNHMRVPAVDPLSMKETLESGLNYVAFDILGMPSGFDFVASADGQRYVEMGDTTPLVSGLTLHVTLPSVATTDVRGQTWTQSEVDQAEVRAELKKVDASGTVVVARLSSHKRTLDYAVNTPGVYRVEVSIKPKHLVKVLGSQPQYATQEYLWIWSNPIYVK